MTIASGPAHSGHSLTIGGAPLSARLAALHLLRQRPDISVYLHSDPTRPWFAEGAVVLLDQGSVSWRAMLAPLITREWEAYLVVTDEGRSEHAHAIGLIDPFQCEAELAQFERRIWSAPPPDSGLLNVPPLGEPLRPSQVLEAGFAESLNLPVLYETGHSECEFAQYLPLGNGMTMVRAFTDGGASDPHEALFGAQCDLMTGLAAFDR